MRSLLLSSFPPEKHSQTKRRHDELQQDVRQAHAHLLDPSLLRYSLDHLPRDTNLLLCALVHLYVCEKPTLI